MEIMDSPFLRTFPASRVPALRTEEPPSAVDQYQRRLRDLYEARHAAYSAWEAVNPRDRIGFLTPDGFLQFEVARPLNDGPS